MHGALQTRARRPLIFLAVFACHCLIFQALLRNVWSPPDRRQLVDDPLILLRLPQPSASVAGPPPPRSRDLPKRLAVTRDAGPPLPRPLPAPGARSRLTPS